MNPTISFIPEDRRLALSRGEVLTEYSRGAVLFADISGFTPLTAAYAKELGSRQGAEELIRQINAVYEATIAEVQRYGGSVIFFSGDAITCWFGEKGGEPLSASSLRAVAAALAMQERMKAFAAVQTPTGRTVSLAVKIAIAAGPARRFVVGDPQIKFEDVLAGATLDRTAKAEKLANPKEILVSEEVIQAAPAQFELTGWREAAEDGLRFAVVTGLTAAIEASPLAALDSGDSQLSEALVSSWLSPALYDKVKLAADSFLAELRPVVPLFLKFTSLDYDGDAEATSKLDAFMRWVQQIVARYEGQLLQLTLGDKGSYLFIVFGAPLAHEDDTDRAVLAALALRAVPAELGFIEEVQIGISRGRAFVGPYGSQTRRTFGATGHETNMAARLMAYARPGQIVVSQRVIDSLTRKHSITSQSLGLISVKGESQPLPVYEIASSSPGQRSSKRGVAGPGTTQYDLITPEWPALFGRQAELAHLDSHLKALAAGQSGLVIIEGEAGIGKSRLVADLLARAREQQVTTLIGEGSAIEQSAVYYGWRAIFAQFFQLDSLPEDSDWQEQVLAFIPPDPALRQLAPLLNAVLPLDLPENELTREMAGLSRANKTQELLVAILQQAAGQQVAGQQAASPPTPGQQPLMIILEDAHWLDSASWALAEVVCQNVSPLLLVIALRPLDSTAGTVLSSLLTEPTASRLHLSPLPAADVTALVSQRLGVTTLPETISSYIMERTEGHPFFSEELAYALRDARLIEIEGNVCRLAPGMHQLSQLDFPNTIEGVITNRIDRLTPQQQLVLKVSSVIGRIFAYRILQDVYPLGSDSNRLTDYLQDLNRLDITQLEAPEPELAYIFKHIITQQVAYNLLLFAQKRELHRKVAEWYEYNPGGYRGDLNNLAPLLAYHWYKSLELQRLDPALAIKAIEYAEKAGDEAIHSYANQEAVRFFSDVEEIAAKLIEAGQTTAFSAERRAYWRLQLGVAYLGLGRMGESRDYLQQALLLLGWPVPESNGRLAVGLLGQLWQRATLRPSTAESANSSALRQAAQAYELLGQIYYLTNQTLPTLYAMLRGLNLAEQAGGYSPELARAYANVSGALALVPLHSQSRASEKRAWQAAEVINTAVTRTYVAFITSVHKINIASWAEAEKGFGEALELATQLGDRRTAGFCVSGLAHVAYYQGQFDHGLSFFQWLRQIARAGKNIEQEATALSGQAAILLHREGCQEAWRLLDEAIPLAASAGQGLSGLTAQANLAITQWLAGESKAARQTADAIYPTISNSSATSFANYKAFVSLLQLYLVLWEQESAGEVAERVKSLCRQFQRYTRVFPFALSAAWRYQGWYDWMIGKPGPAHKAWQKSMAEGHRLGMPFDEAMAYYESGRRLSPGDKNRAVYLERARTLLAGLQATYELKVVESVM